MPLPLPFRHSKVYPTVFKAGVVGDRDSRGELIRVRLSDEDLAKVSAIQDYYDRVGLLSSLQQVFSDALDTHYSVLVSQGSVPPNP